MQGYILCISFILPRDFFSRGELSYSGAKDLSGFFNLTNLTRKIFKAFFSGFSYNFPYFNVFQ